MKKTSKQYFTEANSISKLDLIKDVSLFISLAITIIREGVLQLPIVFYERLMRQGCVIIGKSLRFIQLPCFTSLLQFSVARRGWKPPMWLFLASPGGENFAGLETAQTRNCGSFWTFLIFTNKITKFRDF